MDRDPSSFQNRLLRRQQYVVYITSLAYVLCILLTALINPSGPFPKAFQVPEFAFAVVVGLCCSAIWVVPQRIRAVYLVGFAAQLVVVCFEIVRLLAHDLSPLRLTLWLSINVLISFLVFGSRGGVVANVLTLLTVLVSLLLGGPFSRMQLAEWLTVCITLITTAAIAYVTATFIESNLLAHTQDQGKLQAARQDALTAVYGRGPIEEELERAMHYAQRHNTPLSVIVTDIDHFKSINDQHGHSTGDDVLRAVAKRLRRNVGSSGGMVGRWGGEEFVVLLPGLAKPEALVLAERLRREISEQPLADLRITASFGVASYRGPADTTDQLFGRADQAMYQAKNTGRNLVR